MRAGTVLVGRFEIERAAGSGGMSTVYRALDRVSGRPVALKLVDRSVGLDPARFTREALVLAELRHPGIVAYVAHGTAEDGQPWLAIEWLEGMDLSARLHRKGLSPADALALARRVAEALAYAHAHGVVHRDIKPANVFLEGGEPRRAKLLDFGIARASLAGAQTQTGTVFGTPGYIAPEQARGERVTPAADVFAFGAVLFECIAGRPAYEGDHPMAIVGKILASDAPRLSSACEVPAELDDLVARMLSREAALRPPDGSAVLAEIERIDLDAAPSTITPPSKRPRLLTTREQRYVTVTFARRPDAAPAEASAPTLAAGEDDTSSGVRRLVGSRGAEIETLLDGTLVISTKGLTPSERARRAARLALEIAKAFPVLRLAIATGRAETAPGPGTSEVDGRARGLTEGAKPGSVVVDDLTASLVAPWFDLDRDASAGYRLATERDDAVSRAVAGRRTRFVGRARELALLEATLDQAIEERAARAVVVTGGAGLGKSRLSWELRARLARRDGVRIWTAQCDPVSAGSAFVVVSSLVASGLGIDAKGPASRRGQLEASLRDIGAPQTLFDFVGELLGAQGSAPSPAVELAREGGVALGDRMRRAFEDLIALEVARGPLVLLVDDLHWGDMPSVRWLDGLLRVLSQAPLVVVAFARPEVMETFPKLWSERAALLLPLAELSRAASEAVVRDVLGEAAAPDVVARIVERAGGNAFFLEELLRAHVEGRTEAPESVLAVLDVRLAALDAQARRVLRAASLFGAVFPMRGLVDLLAGDPRRGTTAEDVASWLAVLEEREIIVRRDGGLEGGEYAFRHALLRDAVYGALLEEDRELGHQLVAEWLERATGAGDRADPQVLAQHWDRGGVAEKAIRHYLRAAEMALGGDDLDAVASLVGRGIAKGATGTELGQLRTLEAELHRWRGEAAAQEAAAREAMSLLPSGSAEWLRAARELAGASSGAGSQVDLEALATEVRPHAAREPRGVATVLAEIALRMSLKLQSAPADAVFAELEELAAKVDLGPRALSRIAQARSSRALTAGNVAGHLSSREEARDLCLAAGDLRGAVESQATIAYARMLVGEYERAEQGFREALVDAARLTMTHLEMIVWHNIGLAVLRLGRAEEAIEAERRAAKHFREVGEPRFLGTCLHYEALAHRAAGRPDEARKLYDEYLALDPDKPNRCEALAGLAALLVERGDVEAAIPLATEAVAIVDELGGVDEAEPFIRLALVDALAKAGRTEAREALRVAHARLLETANRITEPEARKSFEERVPEHARILALVRAWGEAGVDRTR